MACGDGCYVWSNQGKDMQDIQCVITGHTLQAAKREHAVLEVTKSSLQRLPLFALEARST